MNPPPHIEMANVYYSVIPPDPGPLPGSIFCLLHRNDHCSELNT